MCISRKTHGVQPDYIQNHRLLFWNLVEIPNIQIQKMSEIIHNTFRIFSCDGVVQPMHMSQIYRVKITQLKFSFNKLVNNIYISPTVSEGRIRVLFQRNRHL